MLRSILFWFIRFLPSSLRHKIYLRLKKILREVVTFSETSSAKCLATKSPKSDVNSGRSYNNSTPSRRRGSGPLPDLPCEDVNRIDESEFGPFPDTTAFHKFLLERIPPRLPLRETYALAHIGRPPEPTVFTHGDLHLRNILIQRHPSVVSSGANTTVRVSGIIDWTCAGWYPSYWEHGKATYVHRTFKQWTDMWMGIAEDVIVKNEQEKQKYMDDLALEKKTWQYID
ncbi:hypothetical protein D9613_007160 [Agrocybe pediades]|uniref:Aminoglycoside phosphotransferase domain-containing protein n=1 Tax=Agrocybe pediades TaxID=84607 RepID=A0A8H4QGP7_9AGAR|nr:hypothetical protein D9613_007160 [Agrocybe pediades]